MIGSAAVTQGVCAPLPRPPFKNVVKIYAPAARFLISPNAIIEEVDTGFSFTEGPLWWKGSLLFTDIPANTIYRYIPGRGHSTVYRKPSGMSDGLALYGTRLLAGEQETHCLTIEDTPGNARPLETHFEGKRLNSPNDITVSRKGWIYFTDPNFGPNHLPPELPFLGVFARSPGGKLIALIKDQRGPNGLALSPDEKILYTSDSTDNVIRAYPLLEPGRVGEGRPVIKYTKRGDRCLDGIKVDPLGNIWTVSPYGIDVVSSAGTLLARINIPRLVSNLGWGGSDGRDLFITGKHILYKIRTRIRGHMGVTKTP